MSRFFLGSPLFSLFGIRGPFFGIMLVLDPPNHTFGPSFICLGLFICLFSLSYYFFSFLFFTKLLVNYKRILFPWNTENSKKRKFRYELVSSFYFVFWYE